jgi:hypothetical protein
VSSGGFCCSMSRRSGQDESCLGRVSSGKAVADGMGSFSYGLAVEVR